MYITSAVNVQNTIQIRFRHRDFILVNEIDNIVTDITYYFIERETHNYILTLNMKTFLFGVNLNGKW